MIHSPYRSLDLSAAPSVEPLTTAEAKTHLREAEDVEDDLIDELIVAARQDVESFTDRALVTQTWKLHLDEFPLSSGKPIFVPMPPLQSITSITYVDPAGDTQTWSASLYDVDAPSGDLAAHGRILPVFGEIYPSTLQQMNAVEIIFVAGYGLAVAVPKGIRAAMKLLIGNWYANREAIIVGTISSETPFAVNRILWPFRALRYD